MPLKDGVTNFLLKAFSQYMKWRTRHIDVYEVKDSREFEDIHKFNYEIFVEELHQYDETPEKKRIDAYHPYNTYFVARHLGRIVGMICITRPSPEGFSVQKKLKNPEILNPYLDKGVEVRLLAIRKEYRGSGLFWKLARAVVEHLINNSAIEVVFISGIQQREGMYRRIGFEPIGEPCQSGQSWFIPMRLTRERFEKLRPSLNL